MRQISKEDRAKIIKHKTNGETEENIAKWLFISKSSVTRIWALFCNTGSFESRKHNCGRKSSLDEKTLKNITAKIEETPDITINEIIEGLDLSISESGLSKRLKKMGYTFKKRLSIRKSKNGQMS
jgi:transposase